MLSKDIAAKQLLLEALAGGAAGADAAEIQALVEAAQAEGGGEEAPATSPLAPGKWRLVWSTQGPTANPLQKALANQARPLAACLPVCLPAHPPSCLPACCLLPACSSSCTCNVAAVPKTFCRLALGLTLTPTRSLTSWLQPPSLPPYIYGCRLRTSRSSAPRATGWKTWCACCRGCACAPALRAPPRPAPLAPLSTSTRRVPVRCCSVLHYVS